MIRVELVIIPPNTEAWMGAPGHLWTRQADWPWRPTEHDPVELWPDGPSVYIRSVYFSFPDLVVVAPERIVVAPNVGLDRPIAGVMPWWPEFDGTLEELESDLRNHGWETAR